MSEEEKKAQDNISDEEREEYSDRRKLGENKMNELCIYCQYYLKEVCPRLKFYYDKENIPCFEPHYRYESKITCKDKIYYNIHHFNKFQKFLGKLIWKLKIEDC